MAAANKASWSQEVANEAVFRTPDKYKTKNLKDSNTCNLRYNEEKDLLLLVTTQGDDEVVLDVVDPSDVIGVKKEESQVNVYSYPHTPPSGYFSRSKKKEIIAEKQDASTKQHPRQAHHVCLEITSGNVDKLIQNIRSVANLSSDNNYLVVVNPHSGKHKSQGVYESTVKLMLDQAGIPHDAISTTHAGHATEILKEPEKFGLKKLTEYNGVITMGGDGTLNEVINGVQSREDSKAILKKMKFGVVGTGTSNGLAASILYESQEKYGILESTFTLCRGQTQSMDLSKYDTTSNTYTSFLTFSWGFIADIDIESECIRFVGGLRNDLWAVWRILALRKYRAKFSYLPMDVDTTAAAEIKMPALTDPVPSNWKTMEVDFVSFWAHQVSHAGETVRSSPESKLNDGIFQLFIIRAPLSRFSLAKISLAFETGNHVKHAAAEFIKCRAYRLEPLTDGSFNDLDGEVIESGPVQACVIPKAMNIFCGSK